VLGKDVDATHWSAHLSAIDNQLILTYWP
jgi:hypothetical protein